MMRIVIVTAEPFGGYHLEPLDKLLAASSDEFYYLIPYESGIQGNGLSGVKVVSDMNIVFSADRLVVVGGPYSAWTNAVARVASDAGKEILYSELAYIGDGIAGAIAKPLPSRLSAMSDGSRFRISSLFGVSPERVEVVGSPQLDLIGELRSERTNRNLTEASLLIVSSVGLPLEALDYLTVAGEALSKLGASVLVRCHPREDARFWLDKGFKISLREENVVDVLRGTNYAIASTGSFNPMLFTAGIPTVSISQCNHIGAPSIYDRLTCQISDPVKVTDLSVWESAADKLYSELDFATYLFGQVGGSARRMLDYWSS
jgi:hypothetical protein